MLTARNMRCIAPINSAKPYVTNYIETALQGSVSTKILRCVVLMISNVESNVAHDIKITSYTFLPLTIEVDIQHVQIGILSTDLGKLHTCR